MPNVANAPFIGLYSKALRDILPCLTGQELHVLLAVASFTNEQGKSWPGIRLLAHLTTYSTTVVSHILKALQDKDLVICTRKNARDPETRALIPDVYAVNPNILMVSDPSSWQEFRFRHASIPESDLADEFAQADRITEADTEKQHQRSRTTGPEGAAMLFPDHVATRNGTPATTSSVNAGPSSSAGSANAPNSRAPRNAPPPGSGGPPSHNLSFAQSVTVEAIRKQVPDMSHEKAAQLVARFGIDQFTAAVLKMRERNKKVPIIRQTGWVIRNLEAGAKYK